MSRRSIGCQSVFQQKWLARELFSPGRPPQAFSFFEFLCWGSIQYDAGPKAKMTTPVAVRLTLKPRFATCLPCRP
eukprot:s755_g19.t1